MSDAVERCFAPPFAPVNGWNISAVMHERAGPGPCYLNQKNRTNGLSKKRTAILKRIVFAPKPESPAASPGFAGLPINNTMRGFNE
jgi:hypothetical protein